MTPERLLQKEKPRKLVSAFDVSSYWGLEERKIIKRLEEDLKSYAVEQGELPDREKTTHFTWLVENGEVVHPDPEIGPIIDHVKDRTPREKQEKDAFLKIRKFLIEEKPGLIVCWFSPKSPEDKEESYTEGRIIVYSIEEEKGKKIVNLYEFGSRQYSFGQQCRIANQFRGHSQEEYYFPNLDKLRETPILLERVKLRQVVEEVATYPEAWEDIASGRVKARMEEVGQAAIPVANKAVARIIRRENPILVGADIEREIERRISWKISYVGGCPGFSNRAILQMMGVESHGFYQNQYFLTLQIGGSGIRVASVEKKTYVKECPYCHRKINACISPGYQCACGKVYTGVC